jgi:hypothetical protein
MLSRVMPLPIPLAPPVVTATLSESNIFTPFTKVSKLLVTEMALPVVKLIIYKCSTVLQCQQKV